MQKTLPAPASQPPVRLELLDGLRGMAALLVVLFHVETAFATTHWFSRGYLAVDLFFLLSGFVLTLAFDRKFARGLGLAGFMRIRAVRLWPVMALGMALGSISALLFHPQAASYVAIALNFFMIPASCSSDPAYCINGPAWSLACELAANVLHVLILWKLSDRALLAFSGLAGLALAFAIIHFGSANIGFYTNDFAGGFLRCAFAYPLGMWMARRWLGAAARASFPGWAGLLPFLTLVLLGAQLSGQAAIVADMAMVLLILPLCFWLAIHARTPRGLLALFEWSGKLSYPVYAVHVPVISLLLIASNVLSLEKGLVLALCGFVIVLAIAELVARSSFANPGHATAARTGRQLAGQA